MAKARSAKQTQTAVEFGVVRLPPELTARVDAEARRMESDRPGSLVSRVEAVRILVHEALAAREERSRQRR